MKDGADTTTSTNGADAIAADNAADNAVATGSNGKSPLESDSSKVEKAAGNTAKISGKGKEYPEEVDNGHASDGKDLTGVSGSAATTTTAKSEGTDSTILNESSGPFIASANTAAAGSTSSNRNNNTPVDDLNRNSFQEIQNIPPTGATNNNDNNGIAQQQQQRQPGAYSQPGFAGSTAYRLQPSAASAVTGGWEFDGYDSDENNNNNNSNEAPLATQREEEGDEEDTTGLVQARPVDEQVQDTASLPVAEPANERNKRHGDAQHRRLFLYLVGGIIFVVTWVLLILWWSGQFDSSDNDSAATPNNSTTETDVVQIDPQDYLKKFLPPETLAWITGDASATANSSTNNATANTPQSLAFQWLVEDPWLQVNYTTQWRIRQRFAMATFYYATGGSLWIQDDNWLSCQHHECEWFAGSTMSILAVLRTAQSPCGDDVSAGVVALELITPHRRRRRNLQLQMPLNDYKLRVRSRTLQVNTTNITADTSEAQSLNYTNVDGHTTNINTNYSEEEKFSVRRLWYFDNNLNGTLPQEIYWLTHLQELDISRNHLKGTISASGLTKLSSLTDATLADNLLSGSFPTEVGTLTKLTTLFFNSMNPAMTGSIPTEIGLLTNLETLVMSFSPLKGVIATEYGALTKLRTFAMAMNQLTGTLPTEMGLLTNLMYSAFFRNSLTGTIPTELQQLTQLAWFQLYSNQLTGSLPTGVGKMTALQELLLHDNALTSTIPTELGLLERVYEMDLSRNQLTGSIPLELGSGPVSNSLQFLLLSHNSLSGSIISSVGNLTNLKVLDLSANDLIGTLPVSLGQLNNIEQLNVSGNVAMTGSVPESLCLNLNETTLGFDCGVSDGSVDNNATKGLCGCNWCSCGPDTIDSVPGK